MIIKFNNIFWQSLQTMITEVEAISLASTKTVASKIKNEWL